MLLVYAEPQGHRAEEKITTYEQLHRKQCRELQSAFYNVACCYQDKKSENWDPRAKGLRDQASGVELGQETQHGRILRRARPRHGAACTPRAMGLTHLNCHGRSQLAFSFRESFHQLLLFVLPFPLCCHLRGKVLPL